MNVHSTEGKPFECDMILNKLTFHIRKISLRWSVDGYDDLVMDLFLFNLNGIIRSSNEIISLFSALIIFTCMLQPTVDSV